MFIEKKSNTKKKEYGALKKVCVACPIRSTCLSKTVQEKRFSVTYYREEYERNIARLNSNRGRYMKERRQSTVEAVFGILPQFLGMRKVNTIGLVQANKVMHMVAIAYNLKRSLKFTKKRVKSDAGVLFYKKRLKKYLEFIKRGLVRLPIRQVLQFA